MSFLRNEFSEIFEELYKITLLTKMTHIKLDCKMFTRKGFKLNGLTGLFRQR